MANNWQPPFKDDKLDIIFSYSSLHNNTIKEKYLHENILKFVFLEIFNKKRKILNLLKIYLF